MTYDIEGMIINAWPSLHTFKYDGWILRISNGYSNRINSIYPLCVSEINLEQKIEHCKKMYSEYGLSPIFRITSDKNLTVLDKKLNELGYSRIDESTVRILNIENKELDNNSSIDIIYKPNKKWIDSYINSKKIKGNEKKAVENMLFNIKEKSLWIIYKINNRNIGYGIGIIEREYIGIYNIYVETSYRGKGYGKELINRLLYEAYNLGAEIAYLSVSSNNKFALNLYDKLGFKEAYKYWYRKRIEL